MKPVLDSRYYELTEHDNISSKDGNSITKLLWNDVIWYMYGKWVNNLLEGRVEVIDNMGLKVMLLQFSKGKLEGKCLFIREGSYISGEWKDGECIKKIIPCNGGWYILNYKHQKPNGCGDYYDSSKTLHYRMEYVNGIYNRVIDYRTDQLFVREGEIMTVGGYLPYSFLRNGITKISKNRALIEVAMYQNDIKTQTLCRVKESTVFIFDSLGHVVYEGTYDQQETLLTPTGNGIIFYNDKMVYQGDVKKGLAHGNGKYYYNGYLMYEGSFKYGTPHGYGTFYHSLQNKSQSEYQFGYDMTTGYQFRDYFRPMLQTPICGKFLDQGELVYTIVAQEFGDEYYADVKLFEAKLYQKQTGFQPYSYQMHTNSALPNADFSVSPPTVNLQPPITQSSTVSPLTPTVSPPTPTVQVATLNPHSPGMSTSTINPAKNPTPQVPLAVKSPPTIHQSLNSLDHSGSMYSSSIPSVEVNPLETSTDPLNIQSSFSETDMSEDYFHYLEEMQYINDFPTPPMTNPCVPPSKPPLQAQALAEDGYNTYPVTVDRGDNSSEKEQDTSKKSKEKIIRPNLRTPKTSNLSNPASYPIEKPSLHSSAFPTLSGDSQGGTLSSDSKQHFLPFDSKSLCSPSSTSNLYNSYDSLNSGIKSQILRTPSKQYWPDELMAAIQKTSSKKIIDSTKPAGTSYSVGLPQKFSRPQASQGNIKILKKEQPMKKNNNTYYYCDC